MHRAALTMLTSLILIGGMLVAATGAQAGPSTERAENRIIELHNDARAANGVNRDLRANRCLDRLAEKQARRQVRKGKLFHQSLRPIQRRCGMGLVGENVGFGFPSAASVLRAWMGSTGHRANILEKRFNRIGVGMALTKQGSPYYAVVLGSA